VGKKTLRFYPEKSKQYKIVLRFGGVEECELSHSPSTPKSLHLLFVSFSPSTTGALAKRLCWH
jgi:hypothetical protein